MAVRSDITVRWDLSPRLIVIDASSQEITMQDLIDTLRTLEAQPEAMDEPYIIDAAGGEDLGGGISVAYTVELQNAQIYFEPRSWITTSGVVDVSDNTGTYCWDYDASWGSLGVEVGNIVYNSSTGAIATILAIDSSSIYSLPLTATPGVRTTWIAGDGYAIYPNELCVTSGGNLVAVDGSGNTLYPILQSVNVQSTLTSSSSATSQNLTAIQYASYQNAVWVSITGTAGTAYPIGTPLSPVNNVTDAHTIAEANGFDEFNFLDDTWNFTNLSLEDDYIFYGLGRNRTTFTFDNTCFLPNVDIHSALVTGECKGISGIYDAHINDFTFLDASTITNRDIIIQGTLLDGSMYIPNDMIGIVKVLDCWSNVPGNDTPTFLWNDSSAYLMMRNYSGGIRLGGYSQANNRTSIDITSGQVQLMNTVTGGFITARGVGYITDDSSGATVNISGLMSKATIADALLDTTLIGYDTENTVAAAMQAFQYVGNQVWVDAVDGSVGTSYPYGTADTPVNTVEQAVTIANNLGLDTIRIVGNYDFDSSILTSGLIFVGDGNTRSSFTFPSKMIIPNSTIRSAEVTGWLSGLSLVDDCHVIDFGSDTFVPNSNEIQVLNTLIQGTTTFPSTYSGTFQVLNCWAMPDASGNPPTLNHGGSSADLQVRNLSGFLNITNVSQNVDIRVFLNSGGVTLDATDTSGNFIFTGTGTLTNDSSGAVVTSDALINKSIIATAVWDEPLSSHLISGTTGRSLSAQQFDGVVTINVTDGSSGTNFPVGTDRVPVNNLTDAKTIAAAQGLNVLKLESNLIVTAGENISGYTITSDIRSEIDIQPGAFTFYTNFDKLGIKGDLNGFTILSDCGIDASGVRGFYGIMDRCFFNGDVSISTDNTQNALFYDCYTGNVTAPPKIDCGGDGAKVSMRGLTGGALFINKTGSTQNMFIDLYSARVGFDSTVEDASITVRGVGYIYLDESSTGAVINTEGLISKGTVSEAVWDEPLADHVTEGTAGKVLSLTEYDNKVFIDTVNGQAGTTFPIGTGAFPVNNLADALTIKEEYGLFTLHIHGSLTVNGGEELNEIIIESHRSFGNSISIVDASMNEVFFQDITVDGSMTGSVRYTTCVLGDIDGFDGGAKNCLLTGNINITGTGSNYLTDCDTYVTDATYKVIDVSNYNLNIIRGRGRYQITNKGGSNTLAVDLAAGAVLIDASCVAGAIGVGGLAILTDQSGAGCTVVDNTVTEPGIAKETTNKIVPFLFAK